MYDRSKLNMEAPVVDSLQDFADIEDYRMGKHGHWSSFPVGALWARYRVCLICGQVRRNYGMVPVLHNGKKPRR